METEEIRCVSNSISRFIHLGLCCAPKNMPCQKDYRSISNLLKLLKPILDNVAGAKVHSPKMLCKEYEELDQSINEAREFVENWCSNMSKICGVVRSRRLILNIHQHSLKICHMLCRSLESTPLASCSSDIQHCILEFQNSKLEVVSEYIEAALIGLREGRVPCSEHLGKAIEFLNLTSSQDLLRETIAIEKEHTRASVDKTRGQLCLIDQAVNLISHIRVYMITLESFKAVNGVQIPVYFRCPLALEVMSDPVIVATGQTYERSSIKKWIDHGLTICPVTRQKLSHLNLIRNHTLEALIANWCKENNVQITKDSNASENGFDSSESQDACPQDLIRMENYPHSLHVSNSTSRTLLEVENGIEKQKNDTFPGYSVEESTVCQIRDDGKFDHSSPEQSYTHSRSGSTSTVVSSIDFPTESSEVSKLSFKPENSNDLSGEVTSDRPNTSYFNKTLGYSPLLSGKQYHSSIQIVQKAVDGNRQYPRTRSLPHDSGPNDLTTTFHVEQLVKDLKSLSNEVQTKASEELRYLAKHNMENRIIIGQCGAIEPLLSLLHSSVKQTQEHAVTALLNLSINGNIKSMIAEAGAIEPLIYVLETGNSEAKENAAATLYSLSVLDECRVQIGRSGAIKALVNLLGSGTLRGKKDAATALFSLSIFHENKARIIQAGAIKYLVDLLDPSTEMVDKAVALLANLSMITEGCLAIAREGAIPLLVEVVETGSQRGKENSASILLQLCLNSPKYCRLVLQEGAVPPLVALSQSGTPRAKEKAQQLLSHFRNQRESAIGRGK